MRKAIINRPTKETIIEVRLDIDGDDESMIKTGIGFLDHMLELFAFWGHFDLKIITKKADLNVDIHHTNEDVGIVLGQAFKKALGDKKGIRRLADASVPMEDVVANVAVDISGRGSFALSTAQLAIAAPRAIEDGYEFEDAEHFMEAFAKHLGANINITLNKCGQDLHATLEPIFKALGKALGEATQIDPRRIGVPSTKGVID